MSGNIKPIDKQALLGDDNENNKRVYINPATGKTSDRATADSVGVPKTTWWRATTHGESNSPLFSAPQLNGKIKLEASEMAVYFPDFTLHKDQDELFWQGTIQGIGEVKIVYPATYPAQKYEVFALELEESFNNELNQLVRSYDAITPVGSVIVTMRLFLLRKVAEG